MQNSPKLPTPDGIKQIRKRYQIRKETCLKKYDALAEAIRKNISKETT